MRLSQPRPKISPPPPAPLIIRQLIWFILLIEEMSRIFFPEQITNLLYIIVTVTEHQVGWRILF